MFKEIEITNYGPIASGKYSFKDINVISGKNGSGKSWLLDLLYFLMTGKTKTYQTPTVVDRRFDRIVLTTDKGVYQFFDSFKTRNSVDNLIEINVNATVSYYDPTNLLIENGPTIEQCMSSRKFLYQLGYTGHIDWSCPLMSNIENKGVFENRAGSGFDNLMTLVPLIFSNNILFMDQPFKSLHPNLIAVIIKGFRPQTFYTTYDENIGVVYPDMSLIELTQN